MTAHAVASFLEQLRRSALLSGEQAAEAEHLAAGVARPAELAAGLIQRGWLTPYQANQLARGRGAELVLGSYLVLEPVGRGGMGQVFKARHRVMERLVALKVIRREQGDAADTIERFRREVRLLAELRHPHIVHAYDAGLIGDVWFLAMELLEGIDLERLVRTRGPLPVDAACAFLRQAALGLDHAHRRGLVHRDVKPSNLFLTGEGIKLLDLGLARPGAAAEQTPGALTRANTVMGTPDYLAPEQALDPRRADARSDLYSLGCTLFDLLTGRPPFPEGTLAQKLLYHQTVPPPALETLRPGLPADLLVLARTLLAKAPEQRPSDAAVVADRLAPLAAADAGLAGRMLAEAAGGSVRSAASGATTASLVQGPAATPERGFTLVPESLPPTAASLIDGKAAVPERGWTLQAESLPPASLIEARAETPPGGFSLIAESVPPTATPLPARRATSVRERPASPEPENWWAGLGPNGRAAVLGIGGGLAALLLLAVLLLAFRGGSPSPDLVFAGREKKTAPPGPEPEKKPALPTEPDKPARKTPPIEKKKPPETAPPEKEPDNPAPAVVLRTLPPTGPKETEDVVVLPTIAPDAGLADLKSGDKAYLSDLREFAFRTTPTNWKFAKNGKVGDPRNPDAGILVAGKPYGKGLGMHPPNTDFIRVCYALGKRGRWFAGAVALDDGDDPPWQIKTTTFVALGDGKVLWRSAGFKDRGIQEPFRVDVRGVAVLELRVHTDYNGANGSRAVWLDPYVIVE